MAKIIDRFLLFLFSLAILVAACVMLLAAFNVIPFDTTRQFIQQVYTDNVTAAATITSLILVVLISLRLFFISVRPGKDNAASIDQRTDYGDIKISLDTVENLSLKAANRTRGVRDLKARVRVNTSGIEIELRTVVDGESSIPEMTEEIQRNVKDFVEETTGIPVAIVSVYVANIVQASPTFKSRVE